MFPINFHSIVERYLEALCNHQSKWISTKTNDRTISFFTPMSTSLFLSDDGSICYLLCVFFVTKALLMKYWQKHLLNMIDRKVDNDKSQSNFPIELSEYDVVDQISGEIGFLIGWFSLALQTVWLEFQCLSVDFFPLKLWALITFFRWFIMQSFFWT